MALSDKPWLRNFLWYGAIFYVVFLGGLSYLAKGWWVLLPVLMIVPMVRLIQIGRK